jgi:hypothetical protein
MSWRIISGSWYRITRLSNSWYRIWIRPAVEGGVAAASDAGRHELGR